MPQKNKKNITRVLLFIETTNMFGRSIIEGIARYALEHNWILDFEQRGQYDPFPEWIKEWNGDGIITRSFNKRSMDILRSVNLPSVELVGANHRFPADIVVDETILGKMVADHFLSSGLKNFAYYAMGKVSWTLRRYQGFQQYLLKKGFPCEFFALPKTRSVFLGPQWKESDRIPLKRWLWHLKKPTGLFAAVDLHAKRVIECCKELGLNVPKDIAVVGVEDDPWFCRLLTPPLSSVNANGTEVGYYAASRLNEKIQSPATSFPQLLVPPSFLTVRQSSGTIAVEDPDIVESLAFIRENACHGIGVSDIIDYTNISLRSLQRGFRKWINRTPEQEIIRVKIELAQKLLLETALPIAIIAKKAGFSSPEYFARAFHRECEMTPVMFRKKNRSL
jgi:LacI family transcriptional regulator